MQVITNLNMENELNAYKSLAIQTVITIKESNLYSQSKEDHLENIKALARIAENKYETGTSHAERVASYARFIGELLNLNNEILEIIELSAILHDIGKMFLPRVDRWKNNSVTDIRFHSSLAYQLLQSINLDQRILEGILYHHENWDGTGYPHGLKKTDIPLSARILATANLLDKMMFNDFCQHSISYESISDQLKNYRNKQLDPYIVDVFLKSLTGSNTFIQLISINLEFLLKRQLML